MKFKGREDRNKFGEDFYDLKGLFIWIGLHLNEANL
jgi:hypothetical protein